MMRNDDILLARARDYVEASNAHDLARIEPMFAPDAHYVSGRTGAYQGTADILAMMKGFFEQFADAAWRTDNWRVVADDGVEFTFILSAGGQDRPGTERVFFDAPGKIRRIEVET